MRTIIGCLAVAACCHSQDVAILSTTAFSIDGTAQIARGEVFDIAVRPSREVLAKFYERSHPKYEVVPESVWPTELEGFRIRATVDDKSYDLPIGKVFGPRQPLGGRAFGPATRGGRARRGSLPGIEP